MKKVVCLLMFAACLAGQSQNLPDAPHAKLKKIFNVRTAVMVGSIVSLSTNIKQNADVLDNVRAKPEAVQIAQIRLGLNSAALAGGIAAMVYTLAKHPKPTADEKRIASLELKNADLNRRVEILEKAMKEKEKLWSMIGHVPGVIP